MRTQNNEVIMKWAIC